MGNFQDFITSLRKSKGYTQSEVAEHLGVIRQTYSHYETGRLAPPLKHINGLASLYRIPVNEFVKRLSPQDAQSVAENEHNEPLIDDESDYLDFLKANSKRVKEMDEEEKMMLYYFGGLSPEDREKAVAVMRALYDVNHKREQIPPPITFVINKNRYMFYLPVSSTLRYGSGKLAVAT